MAPVWLVCVPFVLMAMLDGGASGWLAQGDLKGKPAAGSTFGQRVMGPVFHLVVIATVVLAHGKIGDPREEQAAVV